MIKKLFRQMSTTQIISAMTTTICLLIDSIVIGRLISVDAMSAYGIANPLMIVFTALGTMMVSGVQVTLGKTMGRGDLEGMSACYSTSVLMSLGLGAFGVLLVWLAGNPICTMLGAGNPGPDNPVFSMTGDYLRGFMLGAPFFFLNQIMSAYLQAMGKRKMLLEFCTKMLVRIFLVGGQSCSRILMSPKAVIVRQNLPRTWHRFLVEKARSNIVIR